MNAVRSDDRIRNRDCAIGKSQSHAAVDLLQSDQPVAQLDAFVRNYAGQGGVQVSTMGKQIGRAKFLFGALTENHVEFDFAGSPVPVVPGARRRTVRAIAIRAPALAEPSWRFSRSEF